MNVLYFTHVAHHLDKFDPNYHPKSYLDLSEQGLSKRQICARWNIGYSTLLRWQTEHKELNAVSEAGDAKREDWWLENILKPIATGERRGNPIVAIFAMKSLFKHYRDGWEELEEGASKGRLIEIKMVDAVKPKQEDIVTSVSNEKEEVVE